MSPEAQPPEHLSAAERKIADHLQMLGADQPRPAAALIPNVLRTARWQRALRGPLQITGLVALALADGVGVLLGRRPRRGAR